jgi:3-hexulose-6-phosphate synthase
LCRLHVTINKNSLIKNEKEVQPFMKLQLALDLVNIPQAIELIKEVQDHIDVVEIGTPVVINEGLRAVKEMKEAFPHLTVLADLKIMDAAGYEVSQAAAAGADIITILGAAEDESIKGAVEEAKKQGKQILVDMIAVKDKETRAKELDALGVDYICVHTGYDLQAVGQNSFEDLRIIKSVVKNAKTAIAGGIKLETLQEVINAQPDLVIVGGGITSKDDKKAAAAEIQKLIKEAVSV